ncbi:MAG: hypothetical protein AABW51_03275 [Nanoarchaeota archaeon]
MVFTLFNTQKKNPNEELSQSLVRGLDEIERRKIDRLVLTLYESEPDKSVFGRFINASEHNYYSQDVLDESELDMIDQEKSYSIISLVRENPFGQIRYPSAGIEVFHRTHVHPFLPKLDKRSNFNYVSKGGIYLRDEFKGFIENNVSGAWTSEIVDERVRNAVEEFQTRLIKSN